MSNGPEFCLTCGKSIALVGRAHRCVPPPMVVVKELPSSVSFSGTVVTITPIKKKTGRPRKTPEGFNKTAYQRDLMRKRRAAAKEST